MGLEDINVAVEIVVAGGNAHAGHLLAIAAISNTARQAFFSKCAIVVVHEEQARRGVCGYEDVRPAVFVYIEGNGGEPKRGLNGIDAGFFRDVGECAVAVVAIKRMDGRKQATRSAVNSDTLIGTRSHMNIRSGSCGQVKLHIIGYK